MDKIKINSFVGINGLDKGIGPWATPEDVKEPEDKPVLVKASRLSGRGQELVTTSRWNCPRRVEAEWKPEARPPTSTRKWTTMHGRRISLRERRVNREWRNIWEESCYDCIKYSAPNQLAALMWRWYLNSDFYPYSYPQRL